MYAFDTYDLSENGSDFSMMGTLGYVLEREILVVEMHRCWFVGNRTKVNFIRGSIV